MSELYPQRPETPTYAEPLYAWPEFSIVGAITQVFLRLVSRISTTLRLTGDTDKGSLRLTSDINKGSLKLTSAIDIN